ncbi:HEAT repeat domain-containing protein [Chloroflexota bacterium]
MPSLVEYHIGRLKDKSPRVRAEAAYELGLLGDPVALEALEELFRVETEPEVKKAIQEAGRQLYTRKNAEN